MSLFCQQPQREIQLGVPKVSTEVHQAETKDFVDSPLTGADKFMCGVLYIMCGESNRQEQFGVTHRLVVMNEESTKCTVMSAIPCV